MRGRLTSWLGYPATSTTATRLPKTGRSDELYRLARRSQGVIVIPPVTPESMIAQTIFWVAVVLCVIAHRYILRSAFAAGAAVQHSHTLPPIRRAGEVVWVVLPAVALVFLFIATWRAIEKRQAPVVTPATQVPT